MLFMVYAAVDMVVSGLVILWAAIWVRLGLSVWVNYLPVRPTYATTVLILLLGSILFSLRSANTDTDSDDFVAAMLKKVFVSGVVAPMWAIMAAVLYAIVG